MFKKRNLPRAMQCGALAEMATLTIRIDGVGCQLCNRFDILNADTWYGAICQQSGAKSIDATESNEKMLRRGGGADERETHALRITVDHMRWFDVYVSACLFENHKRAFSCGIFPPHARTAIARCSVHSLCDCSSSKLCDDDKNITNKLRPNRVRTNWHKTIFSLFVFLNGLFKSAFIVCLLKCALACYYAALDRLPQNMVIKENISSMKYTMAFPFSFCAVHIMPDA